MVKREQIKLKYLYRMIRNPHYDKSIKLFTKIIWILRKILLINFNLQVLDQTPYPLE